MSRDIFYVRKLTSCAPSLTVISVMKGAGFISQVYLGAFGVNMLILQVGHFYSKKCMEASQQLSSRYQKNIGAELTHGNAFIELEDCFKLPQLCPTAIHINKIYRPNDIIKTKHL